MAKKPVEKKVEDDPRYHDTWRLLKKYRDVVYLHYYEGYTAPEIAGILGKNVNTVYTQLTRARGLLRQALGGEDDA